MELAADHLDRLLGKSCIDRLVHEGCVAQDRDAVGSDQPQQGCQRARPQEDRHANDQDTSVELGGRQASKTKLQVPSVEPPDDEHAGAHEDDVEEQRRVREQAVDAEHQRHHEIVGGEVAQVVVDARLHLAKVGRFGEALEIAELGHGLEVGEAGADGLRAHRVGELIEIQSVGDSIDGDADSCHRGEDRGRR